MSHAILNPGEKIFVIHRQIVEGDTRRHSRHPPALIQDSLKDNEACSLLGKGSGVAVVAGEIFVNRVDVKEAMAFGI